MNGTSKIKLFVCCHQPFEVPEHPLIAGIQVGVAKAGCHLPQFYYDDTGENISSQNPAYCELTGQYWVWKNIKTDYVGFFHYRRYLYPDPNARCAYCVRKPPILPVLGKLGYAGFPQMIERYDMILPKGENMHISVEEHYAKAPWHHRCDMELVQKIVQEWHPQMVGAMKEYLSGTVCYFGNIYIMRWNIFCEYCQWLFPILDEFDQRADVSKYSPQERRVDGYLAERLLGVYYVYRRSYLRTLELPRVHFYEGKEFFFHRLRNTVLPPGSWRRSIAKRLKGLI